MFQALLLMAAATSMPPAQSVQSKNGEFIFSQYPAKSLAAGQQGSVRFRAEVDAKGNVQGCKVTAGSGYKRLDRETCDLIVDHATFKPTLDIDGKAREAVHDGVVNWRIPGMSAAMVPKMASANNPDKIICKRTTRTGSLVAHSRQCLTQREWDQLAEQNQSEWGGLQGRRGFSICGGPDLPPC